MTITPADSALLYELAAEVRAKQKTYFKTRRNDDLQASKQAEWRLDALLAKYAPTEQMILLDEVS